MIQAQALTTLVDNWDDYEVFVLSAPTAFGKTAVARTLMQALGSVSVISPTNLLVEQFLQEFPDTNTLSRLDSYHCELWDRPCPITRGKLKGFCTEKKCGIKCPASTDLIRAKHLGGPGIYNYHTYLAHKLYRDVLVVDEAHNLLPVIRDRQALLIWQHDYKYPMNMYSPSQINEWIGTLPEHQRMHKKIQLLREASLYECPTYIAERSREWFNGKGTQRGEPEERDCIKLLPVDISQAPPLFWPREVKKTILMSATIGPKDIEQLGLGGRGKRVLYIDCQSPIPATRRPIIALDTISVNRSNIDQAVVRIAQEIERIADKHGGEKGVIHATYQLSNLLSKHLSDPRYMYHDRNSKRDVYERFRRTEPRSGAVLIACGLYEGIDLPGDLGRWQVIAKIPWMSLGSPAVKHLADLDPEWYIWETVKTVIQACGRICRTPEDYGITFLLDSTFNRMYSEGKHMIPDWFRDAIITKEQYEQLCKHKIKE